MILRGLWAVALAVLGLMLFCAITLNGVRTTNDRNALLLQQVLQSIEIQSSLEMTYRDRLGQTRTVRSTQRREESFAIFLERHLLSVQRMQQRHPKGEAE